MNVAVQWLGQAKGAERFVKLYCQNDDQKHPAASRLCKETIVFRWGARQPTGGAERREQEEANEERRSNCDKDDGPVVCEALGWTRFDKPIIRFTEPLQQLSGLRRFVMQDMCEPKTEMAPHGQGLRIGRCLYKYRSERVTD